MSEFEKVLLIGLPSSGKTTFLAALWYLVDGNHSTMLSLDTLHGDREYLNAIRSQWLSCTPVDRTRVINEPITSMRLKNNGNGRIVEFEIPDLSGETFLDQWIRRSWSPGFQDIIDDAKGALLFVHPNEVIEPIRIDQADLIHHEISTERDDNGNPPIYEQPVEWNPRDTPTQVQLVDLLQFVEEYEGLVFPFRLSVIISAWDLVSNAELAPEMWLSKRLPLLHQYLYSNIDKFPYKIYGVSAQGGDYDQAERLMDYQDQSQRIIVVDPDKKRSDLTAPLIWLMSENE